MNPLFNTDSYKLSHKGFMDEGTEFIYSNLTPRSTIYLPVLKDRFDGKIVIFGIQHFILSYLIKDWNDNFFNLPKDVVIREFKETIDAYLGEGAVPTYHFEALHDLGYLPIRIKGLPEGSRVNAKVPFLTIVNTHKDFAWLTNYLETVMSCELWKSSTTATIIREYRQLANEYAIKTVGNANGTEFQIHGFEFRGMSGRHDAAINGAAFLLSSCGTDTVPSLKLIEESYLTSIGSEFIATSVPATEHSIACLGTEVMGELESFRRWITESYPTGIVSVVSDTFDFFKVITDFAKELKEDILNRPPNALGLSKVVFRPDSGDPVDIICGEDIEEIIADSYEEFLNIAEEILHEFIVEETPHGKHGGSISRVFKYNGKVYSVVYSPDWNRYDRQYYYIDNWGDGHTTATEIKYTPEMKGAVECLWETFGGTISDNGYKVLDSHVGLIYGDSITLERAYQIFERLAKKGFASTNVVFGVGSYTMQYLTRDSAGMAVKATWAQVNGTGIELYKDPKTDDGVKKSARGLLRVEKEGDDYVLYDQQTQEQEQQGELKDVFVDGQIVNPQSFKQIRNRLWGGTND